MDRYDMHCHLDFAGDGAAAATRAAAHGVGAFSCTVTPRGYEQARAALAGCANVAVGVGLHPWWVADGTCGPADVSRFEEYAACTRFIGEVGLDFAPRREGTFDNQVRAFERALHACADGGKVVSIHAVRAADIVLDVLERLGTCRGNACILHWFSGSGDELHRAVRLGCFFSVGTRMLATRRGRAYARQVPAERLLLETDLPDGPCAALDSDGWLADLALAQALLEDAVGTPLGPTLAATSGALLGF